MAKKGRKTIEVAIIKADINKQLERQDISESERRALCSFLEHVLFTTNNYAGFNHVEWIKEGGYERWREAGEPGFPEKNKFLGPEYRRCYY